MISESIFNNVTILRSYVLNNTRFSTYWETESVMAELITTSQKFSARSNCLCKVNFLSDKRIYNIKKTFFNYKIKIEIKIQSNLS